MKVNKNKSKRNPQSSLPSWITASHWHSENTRNSHQLRGDFLLFSNYAKQASKLQ